MGRHRKKVENDQKDLKDVPLVWNPEHEKYLASQPISEMATQKGRRGYKRKNKEIENRYSVVETCEMKKFIRPQGRIRWIRNEADTPVEDIEYEIDEVDTNWLSVTDIVVSDKDFVFIMNFFEKHSALEADTQKEWGPHCFEKSKDVCCICHYYPEPQLENDLVICNVCAIAVHQQCYGVPLIPSGDWTCKRCMFAPMESISCLLCPNLDGAFKLTTLDRKWVHVKCAMCLSEVEFPNVTFMEPIDEINKIGATKWKAKCYVCKSADGAATKCSNKQCSKYFHGTCPAMPGVRILAGEQKNLNHIAIKPYCEEHLQEVLDPRLLRQAALPKKDKKTWTPLIPNISKENVVRLQQLCAAAREETILTRVMNYWRMKRKEKKGSALIPRLQNVVKLNKGTVKRNGQAGNDAVQRYWNLIELERANMVMKNVIGYNGYYDGEPEFSDRPRPTCYGRPRDISRFFSGLISKLVKEDKKSFFAGPMKQGTKGGHHFLKPMDLKKIREKCASYGSVKQLQKDFDVMIDNCLRSNKSNTPLYREAKRLEKWAVHFFATAEGNYEKMYSDEWTDGPLDRYVRSGQDLSSWLPLPKWPHQQRCQNLMGDDSKKLSVAKIEPRAH